MLETYPSKFVPIEKTLPGASARLLSMLGTRSMSVGRLYAELRSVESSATYDDLAACLTYLFGAGMIDFSNGTVERTDANKP